MLARGGLQEQMNTAMALELLLLPLLCLLSIPVRSVRTHREEQPSLTFSMYRTNKEARKLSTADKAV